VDIFILESKDAPLSAHCKLTKFDQREIKNNENSNELYWRKGWNLDYYFKFLIYCKVDIFILESKDAPLSAHCKLTKFDQREI